MANSQFGLIWIANTGYTSTKINPLFSQLADIQGGGTLITATGELNCTSNANVGVFESNPTNGGFLKELRFKSLGTNVATVARVYIVNSDLLGFGQQAGNQISVSAVPGAPTGTASANDGFLGSGNYFAKTQSLDLYNQPSALSAQSGVVLVTGPTGSINWVWTAAANANAYILWVGSTSGNQQSKIIIPDGQTTAWIQTTPIGDIASIPGIDTPASSLTNARLHGEVTLGATTLNNTYAQPDVVYTMNIGLPPNTRVLVGLGTTVAAGWVCSAIGGRY